MSLISKTIDTKILKSVSLGSLLIHNGVCGMRANEFLQILIESNNFSKHHIISIYTDEEIDFSKITRLKINI